nr:winged helix-turn-helix domain-containing protein [Klebsiella pneumoniae]
MPENPASYRVVRTKSYLFNKAAHGYRNTLSLTMFGKGLPAMLKEYGLSYEKRRKNQGIQTNLTLREESNADWLPKCDDPVAK